jgi:hypothetical protein
VFLVTAPVALVALVAVLALEEVPLRGPSSPAGPPQPERQTAGCPQPAGVTR